MEAINLRELAIAHRHANWGVIAGLVGAITHWYAAFAVIPYLLYGAWKHGKAAHFGVSARLGVSALMLLPVANVFALALVSHRASRELKRAGLRVGPMGVKANDLPPGSNTMPKAHSASSTTDRGFSMRSFALAGGVLTDQMQDKALVFAMSILLGGAGMLLGCTESE
ncbi:MAG TPA: hypothetical protein VJ733_10575, partial [Candidatus Binatia bacterium]|nr:hypothetical protein [Candidatus Binatia bacterium]